jgi:tRNA threonylcarbamoyladenosine biosynthesis protein TsaE
VSARVYRTNSEEETIGLGRELARELVRPSVILLSGDLGAGKTTLAKGIVEGLGIAQRDDVSSPTFTLVHDYGQSVYHIDLYRLDTEREVASIGLDDLFGGDAIVMVEWGERFLRLMPADRIEIRLYVEDGGRRIEVSGLS